MARAIRIPTIPFAAQARFYTSRTMKVVSQKGTGDSQRHEDRRQKGYPPMRRRDEERS
jgi:hypothetical protein